MVNFAYLHFSLVNLKSSIIFYPSNDIDLNAKK